MKRWDFVQKLNRLGYATDVQRWGGKRWAFMGGSGHYHDLLTIKITDADLLLAQSATETGIINGPESTRMVTYHRVFGFLLLKQNEDTFEVASPSLMKNHRYRYVSREKT